MPRNEIRLVARDVPLQPVRVASVFAEKVEETDEESDEPHILEKEREVSNFSLYQNQSTKLSR